LDCYRHPGQKADIVCIECGRKFCSICVRETGVSHHCPDCHQLELERISERLGVKKKKKKKIEEETKKTPTEAFLEGESDVILPQPEEIEVEEKETITPAQSLPDELKAQRRRLRKPESSKREAEILFLKEIPAKVESETEMELGRFLAEEEVFEKPHIEEVEAEEAVAQTEAREFWGEEEAVKPKRKKVSRLAKILSLQEPDAYDGYITKKPRYLRAVAIAFIACVLCAGAYGGLAWWRHKEFGIFGWLIGVIVGVAVVYASGKHFNWKLGIISAVFAMVSLSAGRILVYMLEVWFPDIIKLPIGTVENFNHALRQFARQFPSVWLVFFVISAAVAFLLSFRPWPLRIHLSSSEPKRV